MKSYIEITLLPNADISLYFLWKKVYQQIHLALVESQDKKSRVKVGVSFPKYQWSDKKAHLGDKLRLFSASRQSLESVDLEQWLSRLRDYVHLTSIRATPKKLNGYAIFKRHQTKNNNERLARRKAKRQDITYEEALLSLKDRKEVYSTAPFIRAKSLSSGENYRIMIVRQKVEIETNPVISSATFNTYGLSSQYPVPLF